MEDCRISCPNFQPLPHFSQYALSFSPNFVNLLAYAKDIPSYSCKYACSEENPEFLDMGCPVEGGFIVAFDPLDGFSIVDTNFTLAVVTGRDHVAAAMGVMGPRTTNLINYYAREKIIILYAFKVSYCCLRLAPLRFLIEKAEGYNSDVHQSVLDKVITTIDEITQVAYGSKNEIIRLRNRV
uniref:Uncharacterized protein n=1 Tax=Glycine max TaxID=3847 RepID=A0A0R0HVD4_SOYBN